MADRPSPTVRSRRLRHEIKRLRADLKLSIEDASALCQRDITPAKLSRWETGARRIDPAELARLLDVYEAEAETRNLPDVLTPEQREILMVLARQARQRGWWQAYGSDAVPEWFQVYIGVEAEASSVCNYEPELIPGLLQTPEYYAAFMAADPAATDEATIEGRLAVRAERQSRLDGNDPPRLWAVMNEAVLRRPVGGPAVMIAQLHHVLAMAMRPTVTVQVLPYKVGAHPAMGGSFVILGFPEMTDPNIAYRDGPVGSLFLEDRGEVAWYRDTWNHLIARAAGPEESAVMISEAAAYLARASTHREGEGDGYRR